jgi:hypothetical protein
VPVRVAERSVATLGCRRPWSKAQVGSRDFPAAALSGVCLVPISPRRCVSAGCGVRWWVDCPAQTLGAGAEQECSGYGGWVWWVSAQRELRPTEGVGGAISKGEGRLLVAFDSALSGEARWTPGSPAP